MAKGLPSNVLLCSDPNIEGHCRVSVALPARFWVVRRLGVLPCCHLSSAKHNCLAEGRCHTVWGEGLCQLAPELCSRGLHTALCHVRRRLAHGSILWQNSIRPRWPSKIFTRVLWLARCSALQQGGQKVAQLGGRRALPGVGGHAGALPAGYDRALFCPTAGPSEGGTTGWQKGAARCRWPCRCPASCVRAMFCPTAERPEGGTTGWQKGAARCRWPCRLPPAPPPPGGSLAAPCRQAAAIRPLVT